MQKIINEGQTFERRVVSDEDALKELAHEPYKCEARRTQGRRWGRSRGGERRGRRRRADNLRQRPT